MAHGATSWAEVEAEFTTIAQSVERAFSTAVNEPKIVSRAPLVESISAPEVRATTTTASSDAAAYSNNRSKCSVTSGSGTAAAAAEPMRKLMTGVFDEALGGRSPAGKHTVYLGEDVRHGG